MSTIRNVLCLASGLFLSVEVSAASVSDLERQIRASEQARIQMQQQIEEMGTELNMVNGRLEEANNTILELQQNQQDLYRQIDELRNQLSGGASVQQQVSKSDNGNVNNKKPEDISSNVGDKEAYQQAVALIMNKRDYNGAKKAFTSFIKTYPNSQLLSNAYFWLGEASLKLNDSTSAKQNFLVVIKDNNSNKRAEALYKLGVIYLQEKNTDYAKKFFALVLRDYPNTTTAKLAQNELNKLK